MVDEEETGERGGEGLSMRASALTAGAVVISEHAASMFGSLGAMVRVWCTHTSCVAG